MDQESVCKITLDDLYNRLWSRVDITGSASFDDMVRVYLVDQLIEISKHLQWIYEDMAEK